MYCLCNKFSSNKTLANVNFSFKIYSAVNGHNDILSSGSPEFAERPASFSSSIALELGRLGSGGEFFLEIMRAYIHLILVIEYPGYTYR